MVPALLDTGPTMAATAAGIDGQDWPLAWEQLARHGHARLPGLLASDACAQARAGYADAARYRSRVVMARHGYGRGEYQYYAYPLPAWLQQLRSALYPRLLPIANLWRRHAGQPPCPATHAEYLAQCHAAGQVRPTPLILRYGPGDHNCLHQDLYGERVFPLQVAVLLSEPGDDFDGGEFVLTEADAHGDRAHVVPLRRGDGVVFAVHSRPVSDGRRWRTVQMRHGVGTVRRGERCTLGCIFHDAR
jgi:hypothetical protein